jgi:molecular chaperone HscB
MTSPDPFALFGLPPSFKIDAPALEKAFLVKARAAHPDFHASDAESQDRAADEASKINEAYVILKTPIRRAEYLLESVGGPTSSEVRDMPPEFLMEVMELREEIEEVRDSGGVETPRGQAMESKLNEELAGVYSEIGDKLAEALASGEPDPELLLDVRRSINVARYLEGLLRDLKA